MNAAYCDTSESDSIVSSTQSSDKSPVYECPCNESLDVLASILGPPNVETLICTVWFCKALHLDVETQLGCSAARIDSCTIQPHKTSKEKQQPLLHVSHISD